MDEIRDEKALLDSVLGYLDEEIAKGDDFANDIDVLGNARMLLENGANYLDAMKQAHEKLHAAENQIKNLEMDKDKLQEKLENFKTREATHSGMCSAYQTAIYQLAIGLGSAKQ